MEKIEEMDYPLNKLTSHFVQTYNCDEYTIFEIEAKELITPQRFDLIAKLMYIESREKNYDTDFMCKAYDESIKAFSYGKYTEPGNAEKNSLQKYHETFNQLIEKIKTEGFDEDISIVPVGKNNVLMDGAHRVACCAYFNKKIKVIKFENLSCDYGYDFFLYRGMDSFYLDAMLIKYCEYKSNVYAACLWPVADNPKMLKETDSVIKLNTKVICSKNCKINYNGMKNLMLQIYGQHDWVGTYENKYEGANGKADPCYKDGETRVYIFEHSDLDKVIELKEQIRDFFKIDKNSIHITDNKAETLQIARLLFNENSIHHLNNGVPYKYKTFNSLFHEYKKELLVNAANTDAYLIEASSVMAAYGLRDSSDLDFLSYLNSPIEFANKNIDNHEDQLVYYKKSKADLILNPSNYFYYQDLKFITLNNLKIFKNTRAENKDIDDCKLIEQFIAKKKVNFQKLKIKVKVLLNKQKQKQRMWKFLIAIIDFLHLHEFAKNIKRKLRMRKKQ